MAIRLCVALMLMVLAVSADAQEFRAFNPIPTPEAAPEGAAPVAQIRPVRQTEAADDLGKIMGAWNQGDQLNKYIGEGFFDKSRLTDAVDTQVPRDAQVRVLSVRGVQTLQQFQRPAPNGGGTEIISTVSVTGSTQIEFNDVDRGFRRLEGTNEYVLKITETYE